MDEIIIALLKCKGFGNKKICKYIIDNEYDHEKIKVNLKNFLGIEYNNFLNYIKIAQKEIKENLNCGIYLITMLNEKFPKKLLEGKDPIIYLYYKGNVELLNSSCLGIIGSREASKDSLDNARKAAEYYAMNDITIVSGLAIGIDAEAHKGALNINGKTIAVLPSDLLNIVPKTNDYIAKEILKRNGLLISEYSIGQKTDKYCYVKRDRIQSAISEALLVIEANEKSGTMITVNYADEINKKVYQLIENSKKNNKISNNIDLNSTQDCLKLLKYIKESNLNNGDNQVEQLKLF